MLLKKNKPTVNSLQTKIDSTLSMFVSTKNSLARLITEQETLLADIEEERIRLAHEAFLVQEQKDKTATVFNKLTELIG